MKCLALSYKNSLKAALYITSFFGWAIVMTKQWEKPPFSYTVKENVGGGTELSGSKSFSTWVALSQRGKRRTQPHGPGMGGFSDFHSVAIPLGQAGDGARESVIIWLSMFLSHKREVTYIESTALSDKRDIKEFSPLPQHKGSSSLSLYFTFSVSMPFFKQLLSPYSL